jgi:hypothetical protein
MTMTDFPTWLDWLPDGFDSWDAWVAIGTLLLAFATACLGVLALRGMKTSENSASAALRSAGAAEAALASSIRPMLVNVVKGGDPRVEPGGSAGVLRVTVPFRNVGGGLALLEGPMLEVASDDYERWETTTRASALPAGEQEDLSFALHCKDETSKTTLETHINQHGFVVEARYRDLDGRQPGRTRAKCEHLPSKGWQVTRIELFAGDAPTPFATLPGRSVTVRVGPDDGISPSASDHIERTAGT